jgi:hypothetical protein
MVLDMVLVDVDDGVVCDGMCDGRDEEDCSKELSPSGVGMDCGLVECKLSDNDEGD